MKKFKFLILLLVAFTLFCSQNNGEQSGIQEAEQTAGERENLVISDDDLVFSKHEVTFIELGADRCIPCKAMQPVLQEIAQEYKDIIQVVFYDVWKNSNYAKDYRVQMIPTQVFIDKSGQEIFRHVGFFGKDEIIEMLKDKNIL